MEAALARHGFSLAEIRSMGLDEAEAFMEILYPPQKTGAVKSLRQNWKRWKKQ